MVRNVIFTLNVVIGTAKRYYRYRGITALPVTVSSSTVLNGNRRN